MQPPELPAWAHVPGATPTADQARLAGAAALWMGARPPDPRFDAGIDYALLLLRTAFFWETHEILEPLWRALPPNSGERAALRAIIQLANAGLKLRMERPQAALRLLADAHATLALTHEGCLGFEVEALQRRIEADCDRLRSEGQIDPQWTVARTCIKMQKTP